MIVQCSTRLAVRPSYLGASLFYNQLPNGTLDSASLHGGCPVLSSDPKWASNVWVWNGPRFFLHPAKSVTNISAGASNPSDSYHARNGKHDVYALHEDAVRSRRVMNRMRVADLLSSHALVGDGTLDGDDTVTENRGQTKSKSYDGGDWDTVDDAYIRAVIRRSRGVPSTPFDETGPYLGTKGAAARVAKEKKGEQYEAMTQDEIENPGLLEKERELAKLIDDIEEKASQEYYNPR